MKKILTIFTPTYNRAYILPKLYKSLKSQTNKNFIWLIVDDGSNDGTDKLVREWIEESILEIKYIQQKNQGKHIAHNTGVENCTTELFFCVDSDDYLLNNAVEDIVKEFYKIKDEDICGIVSVRMNDNLVPIGTNLPDFIEYSSLSELYEKYGFKGDTSLVFKTSIIKKYKFPKIYGEKFIGEEYIYCQIDQHYKLYISHSKYYICEYLNDGYTTNMFKLIADNPKGYMLLKKMKLKCSNKLHIKYKAAALYLVGGWLSKEENIIKNSPYKLITMLSTPLAICVYYTRYKRILSDRSKSRRV